jgi:hypothetical protein
MNKTIMHVWRFPNTLLIIQNSLGVAMQFVACALGVKGFDMKPFRLAHLPKWMFVSTVYTGVLFTRWDHIQTHEPQRHRR